MTRALLRVALLADGPSDRALLPMLSWALARCQPTLELAQPGFRTRVARNAIADEVRETIELFDPEILFVHRDAEAQDPEMRRQEIPDIDRTLFA